MVRVVQEMFIRQGVQKRHQLGFLQIGELHTAVHHMVHQRIDVFGVFHAFALKVDDFVQGGETPVVHVWCRDGNIA